MCHGVRRHQVPRRGGRGSVVSHLQRGARGAGAGRYLFSFNRNISEHLEMSLCHGIMGLWLSDITALRPLCEFVSQGSKIFFVKPANGKGIKGNLQDIFLSPKK